MFTQLKKTQHLETSSPILCPLLEKTQHLGTLSPQLFPLAEMTQHLDQLYQSELPVHHSAAELLKMMKVWS